MGVRKIFIVLITVVACVLIGAFVLNILLPNVTSALVNASEDMLFKATGMKFDFNNDNNIGSSNQQQTYNDSNTASNTNNLRNGAGVEGYN